MSPIDIEKYRPYVADLMLTDEEIIEYVGAIKRIAEHILNTKYKLEG